MQEEHHGLEPHMIVLRMKKTFPMRIGEWFCAFVLAHWGVLLLTNDNVMSATAPAWRAMLSMATENHWGAIMLLLGLSRLAVLAINGAWRRSPHYRAAGAFFSVFIWLQMTFALMANDTTTTGLAVYPWILLLDFWNAGRAAADASASDGKSKGRLPV